MTPGLLFIGVKANKTEYLERDKPTKATGFGLKKMALGIAVPTVA